MAPRIAALLVATTAMAGCRAAPDSTPPSPPTAAAEVQCEAGDTVEFPLSPGGTPEATPTFVRAHACGLRIVDVRERDELGGALGIIEGAEHVPQRRVAIEAQAWEPSDPVVLVCRSGRRSGAAARELQELGFTRVASLTGGMLAWHAAGLPVAEGETVRSAASPDPRMRRELTRDDVAAHIADRDHVRWTKAATLLLHGTQACVDGRDAHAIVGTPGGDAGELVLGLATAERFTGIAFDSAKIEQVFDAYLQAFGHFYLHTDEHAVAALFDHLHQRDLDLRLPTAEDTRAAEQFLAAPPAAARSLLIDLLAQPEFVGCGHLRLMLQHPEEYGVRRGLVADVLRVVFRRLWGGSAAIEFVVLEGAHQEAAIVSVELAHEVRAFTRIPLVSPRLRDTEVFVTHPQVARFVRRENAAFLVQDAPFLSTEGLDEPAFFDALEDLARRQLGATLNHLAPGLPRYRARFDGDHFDVLGPTEAP